ncbi:MAG: DUF4118 domain-containing protein [Clostridia bacterium]|nr:DUF4118 domain-containing protein [Clostridia bacterium]
MKKTLKNIGITSVILFVAFLLSLLFQNVFDVKEHVSTVFVFAVFLISLRTEGYLYGIVSAFIGVLLINYVFAFPYFAFNFTLPVNLISAIIMIFLSILTCTLTAKIKKHEQEKAEIEKERMRANLLRAVSHDLRTPLTTIYGSASTLLESPSSLDEGQTQGILHGIKEDSEWLLRMVENLLSVTRIDSGRVKISKTPTVIEELIDSVILKFHKRYPNQKVELTIPEDILIIPMDAMLISQVLTNLLENAVQHTEHMTQLSLSIYRSGQQAVFQVEDNGGGINPELLPNIFTGYSGLSDEHSDSHKHNAGIGLSVCATIIKAHGGEIFANNNQKGGASFWFTLSVEDTHDEQ